MKKLYFFVAFFVATSLGVLNAQTGQDTLFYENFDSLNALTDLGFSESPNGDDLTGVIFDGDNYGNAAPASRPDGWFLALAFADVDGENTVIAANSWTTQIAPSANFFILPPIFIADNSAMLYYKSAPFQTPRFLDGFVVLGQVGSNLETTFSDTLKKYGEFVSFAGGDSSNFDNYVFTDGFIHGSDGLFIEQNADGDNARQRGVLRPDSISLAQYAGQTVYLAFMHNSTDDNLISVDEIFVKGTQTLSTAKLDNSEMISVFPNPARELINLTIESKTVAPVRVEIFGNDGKLAYSKYLGTFLKGTYPVQIPVDGLSSGNYFVKVSMGNQAVTKTFVKQ